MPHLHDLLHRGDPDEIVREIDRRSAGGDHRGVLAVRDACLAATRDLGRQLFGPARYAEYRLALEAPGSLAAGVVLPGTGRFTLGPLTEVVAQHHAFDEVADDLDGVVRPLVAQERVLRGEDLVDDPRADTHEVDLPGVLQPWEPRYALPVYRASEVLEPAPPDGRLGVVDPAGHLHRPAPAGGPDRRRPQPRPADARGLVEALRAVVAPWGDASGGVVRAARVQGGAAEAVARVRDGEAQLAPLAVPDVMARLAWAGASGGARAPRRGGAAGRAAAWEVAHAATGVPPGAHPDELEFHLEELAWYAFEDPGLSGWQLTLAVAGDGWAAALAAHDPHEDDDGT